jgi:hypothetical protein
MQPKYACADVCFRRSFTDTALTFSVVMLNAVIDLVSFSGGAACLPAVGVWLA